MTQGKYEDPIRFSIPNQLHYIPIALDFAETVAGYKGFNDQARSEIRLGMEEALNNAIKSYPPGESAEIDILLNPAKLRLEISITEKGMPFDEMLLEKMLKETDDDGEISSRGLGLRLIRHLMDEVSFINRGREGKETQLVKYLGRNGSSSSQQTTEPQNTATNCTPLI